MWVYQNTTVLINTVIVLSMNIYNIEVSGWTLVSGSAANATRRTPGGDEVLRGDTETWRGKSIQGAN